MFASRRYKDSEGECLHTRSKCPASPQTSSRPPQHPMWNMPTAYFVQSRQLQQRPLFYHRRQSSADECQAPKESRNHSQATRQCKRLDQIFIPCTSHRNCAHRGLMEVFKTCGHPWIPIFFNKVMNKKIARFLSLCTLFFLWNKTSSV